MKKKFAKLLCLVMAGTMAFSAFGCDDEDSTGGGGGGGGALTEDQIFSQVTNAASTMDFSGSYTVSMVMTGTGEGHTDSGIQMVNYNRTIKLAYNGDTKEGYATTGFTQSNNGTVLQEYNVVNKIAKETDKYVAYSVMDVPDIETDPTGQTMKKMVVGESYSSAYYLAERAGELGMEMEIEDRVAEMSVLKQAPTIAEYKAKFVEFYGTDSTVDVSVKTETDGSLVVKLDQDSKISKTVEEDGQSENLYMNMDGTAEYVLKDNKLSKIAVSAVVSEKMYPEDDGGNSEMTMTVEFGKFDQAGFDAISTADAVVTPGKEIKAQPIEMVYNVGGYSYEGRRYIDTEGSAVTMETQKQGFANGLMANYSYSFENARYYSDEAKTKELTAESVVAMSDADWLALDKVYVFADIPTGKAFVEETMSFSHPDWWNWYCQVFLEDDYGPEEAGTYEFEQIEGYTVNVYVNDVKQAADATSFDMEAGKVYKVRYEIVLTDPADLIFGDDAFDF